MKRFFISSLNRVAAFPTGVVTLSQLELIASRFSLYNIELLEYIFSPITMIRKFLFAIGSPWPKSSVLLHAQPNCAYFQTDKHQFAFFVCSRFATARVSCCCC
jgi:hypothetical protein